MYMTNYRAICKGLAGQRLLVPEDKVLQELYTLQDKDYNKDFYISIFKYNQKHFDLYKQTNTLSGISDNISNMIVFDFDDRSNVENARKDALTLVGRLVQKGFKLEDIVISFSGGKGLHVEVNTNQDFTKQQLVNIRQALSGDLETTDPSIKDTQRILRAPLTKHNETGLFKIPITFDELTKLSVKEMQVLAKDPDELRYTLAENLFTHKASVPDSINQLAKDAKKEKKEAVSNSDKPDFNKNKTGFTNAKYALSEGYFEEGESHEAACILAATMHGLGWHKELAYNHIKATLRLRAQRLGLNDVTDDKKKEIWKLVEGVYSPTWKGGMYSEESNELLLSTKERYNIQDKFENNLVLTLPEVNNIFGDFARNIDKNTLKLGITSFDHEIRVTTSTLVGLLAAPSAGKSSVSFGILNATSNDGIKSMFFSLDMAAPQVYQRLAQRHTGYDSDRLFKAYQSKDTAVIERVEKTLSEQYKNVKFSFRGGISVEDIRSAILKEKELTGEVPKLVVVDYLECINTQFSDPTVSKGYAARMLKDIANEFAICVLLLVQPPKVAGDPSYELNSYTDIKGSSVVSEACSQVFTLHRPGFNPKETSDDNYLTLTVVKNRMGQLGSFDYHWTGVTGAIRELSGTEEGDLKALREEKQRERREDDL